MENVNHPKHYNLQGKKECIEQMLEDYGLEVTVIFCLTNAYKYIYRAGNKENNPKSQDMEKARWYFNYAKTHGMDALDNKNVSKLINYVKKNV